MPATAKRLDSGHRPDRHACPQASRRDDLQAALPAGAARNAVDCALWDLEAKQTGRRVWQLAGLPAPGPEITAYTLSLDTPEEMRAAAAQQRPSPAPEDQARHARRHAPAGGGAGRARRARTIIVDANEGWTAEVYADLAPHLIRLGVAMVEQPLPAGADDMLAEIARPLPVCADESCHDRALAARRCAASMTWSTSSSTRPAA